MIDDDERPADSIGPVDPDGDTRWAAPTTHQARGSVKRAVDRLLDALAPERVVKRAPRLPAAIERHRTPRGCVLQAAAAAVTVTWFPDAAADATIGELQVTAWRGVVSRPGSAHRAPGGASVASELTLVPVDRGADGWAWRAADGTIYDTEALVAHCGAVLEQLVATSDR
jgi:hypothetical protein